ncbi:trypsin-like serine peptidase [Halovulum sp. GXIMD14793]
MLRVAFFLFAMLPGLVLADSPLRALDHVDEARDWVAVGRVNIGHDGFCTGTLIAPGLVLTAAHCFFDPQSGGRLPDSQVSFVAGWSDGHAESIRGARRVMIDPDYRYSLHPNNVQITNDLALIELDRPIRETAALPFERATRPRTGSAVGIVSYAQGRADVPSIQDSCTVLGQHKRVMALSCDVTFGASGSPIFDMSGPRPRIVSVVSAKGRLAGKTAAFTMAIDGKVETLMSLLDANEPERKTAQVGTGERAVPMGGATNLRNRLPQITND